MGLGGPLVLFLPLMGCTSTCRGPACEGAWPASVLHRVTGEQLAAATTVDDLPFQVAGSLADGAGWSFGARRGRVVVGMPERGSVVWFAPPAEQVDLETVAVGRLDRLGEGFGSAVAFADTDGDGEDELWIGAPDWDDGRGAVYRYDLDAADPEAFVHRRTGTTPDDGLGTTVVACGDLDGDGLEDIVTTAPRLVRVPGRDLTIPRLAGAVVQLDPTEVGPIDADRTWWGDESGAGAGWSLACRDDLTGDGQADLAIGAPFAGPDDNGVVFVRPGGLELTDGPLLRTDPFTFLPPDEGPLRFGSSLSTHQSTLAVGAPHAEAGSGRVYVYDGAIGFPGLARPVVQLDNPRELPEHFGAHVALGDLDADGMADLIVGAPDRRRVDTTNDARTDYDVGALWSWTGVDRPDWTTQAPDLTGDHAFQRLGRVPQLADLDGDGADELLLVVRAADPGRAP